MGSRGYICQRLLGQGAFSRVYRVEDRADHRIYACKTSENIRILEREASVMACVDHPLFPKYIGFWEKMGLGFLIMEYIPGENLEEMRKRRGGFSPRQTVNIGVELAEGLSYLHNRKEAFLFRDIKPANIIIRQDGRAKLIDFGCACSGRERITSRAGSPGFAAPEQLCEGGILTPACDVYGLGRTLRAVMGPGEGIFFRRSRRGRRLMHILELCIEERAEKRIADMESVRTALKDLMILF